jgi:hypothetical protein
LKKVLLPSLILLTLVLATGGAVWADTVDDPLHGFCNGSAGSCTDNGTNTPLGNSTKFGFSISPGPQTGDLILDILVPNNYALPASFAITGTQCGTANNVACSGTATLFSTTAWTGGSLAGYLGISGSPNNPIGAYLPTSQSLDPGATGFFVFQVDTGTSKIWDNSNEGNGPTFDLPGGGFGSDLGGYIVGFCGTGCTGNTDPYVATANSGALLVEWHTWCQSLALLMLGAGLLGLGFAGRRAGNRLTNRSKLNPEPRPIQAGFFRSSSLRSLFCLSARANCVLPPRLPPNRRPSGESITTSSRQPPPHPFSQHRSDPQFQLLENRIPSSRLDDNKRQVCPQVI